MSLEREKFDAHMGMHEKCCTREGAPLFELFEDLLDEVCNSSREDKKWNFLLLQKLEYLGEALSPHYVSFLDLRESKGQLKDS